jgi:hypothetical protein
LRKDERRNPLLPEGESVGEGISLDKDEVAHSGHMRCAGDFGDDSRAVPNVNLTDNAADKLGIENTPVGVRNVRAKTPASQDGSAGSVTRAANMSAWPRGS